MPELPEVETVRRGLQPVLEGARFVRVEARRPDLRFPLPPDFAERLVGKRVDALTRRAKFLVARVAGGPDLICHLGMSGSFRIELDEASTTPGRFHHERSRNPAHDHVVFTVAALDGGLSRIVFNDPRRFGFMLFAETQDHPMLASLGVEPLGDRLDGALLSRLFGGRTTSLKAALLDQRLIAGLGNIYVCEALWRAGLSPRRTAGSIASSSGNATARGLRLALAIRSVLADAIEAGGSSLRDYSGANGALGAFQHSFCVYDREGQPCRKTGCSGTVARIVQNGRSTFFCPACQR